MRLVKYCSVGASMTSGREGCVEWKVVYASIWYVADWKEQLLRGRAPATSGTM